MPSCGADSRAEDTKTTAQDALRKGLMDMIDACEVISEKFRDERERFVNAGGEAVET
jgi:hypothetical protein